MDILYWKNAERSATGISAGVSRREEAFRALGLLANRWFRIAGYAGLFYRSNHSRGRFCNQ